MEEQKGSAAPSSDAKLKKTMYVLVAVAVVLGAVLAYVWFERTSLINDLNVEKDDLTAQMVALQNDYASLSSDYESIKGSSHSLGQNLHDQITHGNTFVD